MSDSGVIESPLLHDSPTDSQLDAIGDEIATFAARIDVAEHALLTRLRVFDAHEAWARAGAISCAHWLSWRIGIGLKAAREKVRVARALGELPEVDRRFGLGELSYSKVRAITRVASPDTEQDFVDIAMHATASQIERLTRAYRRSCDAVGDVGGVVRDQRRFVRRMEMIGGMVRIEAQLPAEEAAILWDALTSAEDGALAGQAQAQARAGASAGASAEAPGPASSAEPQSAPCETASDHAIEARRADALVDIARAYLRHQPRTLGSGYDLVLITSPELLRGDGSPSLDIGGLLPDGTPVPRRIAQMLACDAARIDVSVGEHGELLDVGRSTRSIPSAIGRALWLRDGGCRVPGCGHRRHLHGHHIEPWSAGGPTKLSNLVLVCTRHHRMIHEGQLSIELRDGMLAFVDAMGRSMSAAPPRAGSGNGAGNGAELEALELFLRDADVHIDPSVNAPRWDGAPLDLADSLAWMFMAHRPPSPRRAGAVMRERW